MQIQVNKIIGKKLSTEMLKEWRDVLLSVEAERPSAGDVGDSAAEDVRDDVFERRWQVREFCVSRFHSAVVSLLALVSDTDGLAGVANASLVQT